MDTGDAAQDAPSLSLQQVNGETWPDGQLEHSGLEPAGHVMDNVASKTL